jgi:very-short-patch-repair endonuclease
MWKENIVLYEAKNKNFSRANRKAGNLSEALLWLKLKDRNLNGIKFSRQVRIGNYIADFYCKDRKVVIEIDGWTHDDKFEYDSQRDKFLSDHGITAIHIEDADVKKHMDKVIYVLEHHWALQPTPSAPRPPRPSGELVRTK